MHFEHSARIEELRRPPDLMIFGGRPAESRIRFDRTRVLVPHAAPRMSAVGEEARHGVAEHRPEAPNA